MSASEKLQALYDEHARALAEDSGTLEPYRVYSALPQIVAVVEAAEVFAEEVPQYGTPDKPWASENPDSGPVLAALAALEEALS